MPISLAAVLFGVLAVLLGVLSAEIIKRFTKSRKWVAWLDWWSEFDAVPGINQIVGHSQGIMPRKRNGENSENYCLDTGLAWVGVLEDGNLRVAQAL